MSTHEVKVVKIAEILAHPSADRLDLVSVWGYTCCVRKGQFNVGDLAAFIEPDYVVPLDRPEFAFLSKPGHPDRTKQRIAVCKLRGVYSQGLLVAAPAGAQEGDDVMELLGVHRWEPGETGLVKGGFSEKGPEVTAPRYDLDNWKKYRNLLEPGEEVILTAKIHGTNSRFCFHGGRMWCGSHGQWKYPPGITVGTEDNEQVTPSNAWWEALKQNPWLEDWCKANPGVVVYGEVYGPTIQKGFNYGLQGSELGVAVFDVLENGRWTPNVEFKQARYVGLHFVQTVYEGPYSAAVVEELAEAPETFNGAGGVREGVVIKLANERFDLRLGRVALKHVSNQYLSKEQ